MRKLYGITLLEASHTCKKKPPVDFFHVTLIFTIWKYELVQSWASVISQFGNLKLSSAACSNRKLEEGEFSGRVRAILHTLVTCKKGYSFSLLPSLYLFLYFHFLNIAAETSRVVNVYMIYMQNVFLPVPNEAVADDPGPVFVLQADQRQVETAVHLWGIESLPIGSWNCNLPTFMENLTDIQTNRLIYQPTDRTKIKTIVDSILRPHIESQKRSASLHHSNFDYFADSKKNMFIKQPHDFFFLFRC